MIVNIHKKNIKITETTTKQVEKSLKRLEKFSKYINDQTIAKVEIRSYPEKIYKITVNINVPLNGTIHGEVEHPDLYVAIKKMIDPLIHQLNRFKTEKEPKNSVGLGEAILKNMQEQNSEYEVEELEEENSYNDYDKKS